MYTDTVIYNHQSVDGDKDPAVVQRYWNSFPYSENIEVFTWDKLHQSYSYGPNADGIMQRFVYSPTNKATLYRLFFHNPKNSDEGANYGFCITNKKHYWTEKVSIETRTLHISEDINSFTVYKIKGKAIKELEFYAQNLCTFLERSYPVKIETIVCDFTKDELGNLFF